MGSLFEFLKKYSLIRSIIALLMGVALIIWPEVFIRIIVYLIGSYVVILGIVSLLSVRKGGGTASVLGGILTIVLGVCMFLFYMQIASIFPIFMGVLFILLGVIQFFQGVQARKYTGKINIFQMVMGALVLAGGVVGVLAPAAVASFLFQIFGAIMIIAGINEFSFYLSMRKINKDVRDMKKTEKE